MRVPIYLVVKGSGQFDKNGIEYEMILEAKLTHNAASEVAKRYEGATIRKLIADKEVTLNSF